MTRRTPLAAAIAAILLPAAATAQVDTSDWKCQYCPFPEGYRAEYEAGVTDVSDTDARYGNGTGYDDEGTYLDVGGEGSYAKDGTRVSWYAEDLGLDSRVVDISVARPGTFSVDLGYSELPYRLFGTTRTVYSRSGDAYSLPSGWVRAPVTSGMSGLRGALRPVQIGDDRSMLEFGASYLPTRDIDVYANYRRQERDGIRIMSGANFTQGAYIPRTIDDYTDEIDVGAKYSRDTFDVTLAYYASLYGNRINHLLWDNPFASFPGADTERTAVEPDNSFQQVSLSGTYRADAWDTIVAVSLATGRGEQDANLLPYTSNPNLASPLPRTSLDGKVDTSNYALTITASPFAKARVKLAYRYDDRNNKTPVSDWSRVITDSFVSGDTEENVPYSFQRSRLNLSGSYRLFDTVTLLAGYDRTALDRDYQEVASQTEDEGWGKLRWKPTPYLEASFRGGASKRDIGKYDTDVAMTLDQNPLMRKYNLAYRFREFGEVSLNASLPKYPLSVGMTWFKADDNYTHSELGMTESQEDRYSFDFSWAFNKKTSVYLSLGNETIDAEQVGSETFSGPMWTARHKDDFQHYGGGVTLTGIADKFDLTVDFGHGEGETRIRYTEMVVVPEQLPKLTSDIDTADVTATYHHSERLSFEFAARYENLDVHDWALDGVRPDTIPTVLTMGARAYDYNIWAFGISAHYRTQ